jgi:hypothetical protein
MRRAVGLDAQERAVVARDLRAHPEVWVAGEHRTPQRRGAARHDNLCGLSSRAGWWVSACGATHTSLQLQPRFQDVLIAVSLAVVSACAADSLAGAAGSNAPLICADCEKSEPGKGSSSASGSQAECTLAYLERDIDRDEAETLGFPVKDAQALIESPIDTPAMWVAKSTEGGGPATGYDRDTRIRGALDRVVQLSLARSRSV